MTLLSTLTVPLRTNTHRRRIAGSTALTGNRRLTPSQSADRLFDVPSYSVRFFILIVQLNNHFGDESERD